MTIHPQGWRFQAWKTTEPLGGLAPGIQAEMAHLSPPVPLQQSCRPGGLASQTTPGPERGGKVVCGPRLPLPVEVLRKLCQYVSVHAALELKLTALKPVRDGRASWG